MLSAYMRFKYPNLVAGSIAASAPIFLLSANSKRDFFWEDVTKVINFASFINYTLYYYLYNSGKTSSFWSFFFLDLSKSSRNKLFWQDFNAVSPKCVDRVKKAFVMMDVISKKPGGKSCERTLRHPLCVTILGWF